MKAKPEVRIVKTGEKDKCTLTLDISNISETEILIFFNSLNYLQKSLLSDINSLDRFFSESGFTEADQDLKERITSGYLRSVEIIEMINLHYSKNFKNETPGS